MGLFDFVRDIGRKIFNSDSEANDKIKAEIESSLKGIEGLTVDYDPKSGNVKLGGATSSAEALQKAILIAGNTKGVANVTIDSMKAPSAEDQTEYYIIKSGDTLSAIAQHYYKDANKYPKIFEANRDQLDNPDKIQVGQQLKIPE